MKRTFAAFQGPNGWYVARVDRDGSHHQPPHGGNLPERAARREARARNAFCPDCGRGDGEHDSGYSCSSR